MQMNDKVLVVIGNGPSLRGFDFNKFREVKTLGMNAAYRYWDKINWYPNYYSCLDKELIATHHQQIYQLLKEKKVERIFVTGDFLQFYPDAAYDPRIDFFDSFNKHWYKQRGAKYGIEDKTDSSAFLTEYPTKVTTGSYALRYGIHLGYKKILLLGIDCRYVEVVSGSEIVGELKMVMKNTPKSNPNYFFDDYQKAGDSFQIPNPEVHGGNLHLQAFEAIAHDMQVYVPNVKIINCNKQSELYVKKVFPYEDFDKAIKENLLGAIVVPTTYFELNRIIENLYIWDSPAYQPYMSFPNQPSVYLHFVFNSFRNEQVESLIKEVFNKTYILSRCFAGIKFSYCNLEGDRDLYVRGKKGIALPLEGYKSGPNNQFFTTIEQFAKDYPYIFYMETDCLPIKADWLNKLTEIVNNSENFWLKGSIYRGNSPIDRDFQNHINGNAIYATGNPDFQRFVKEVWKPELINTIQSEKPSLAYDCFLDLYFNKASAKDRNKQWCQWQNIAHKFTYTDFIQNHSGTKEAEGLAEFSLHQVSRYNPDTYIIHCPHFRQELSIKFTPEKLVDISRATQLKNQIKASIKAKENKPEFVYLNYFKVGKVEDEFNNTKKMGLFKFQGNYRKDNFAAFSFAGNIKPGANVYAKIKVKTSNNANIITALNRDGNGKFEGSLKEYKIEKGLHELIVEHSFKNEQKGFRVQIGVNTDELTELTLYLPMVEKI